MAKSLPRSPLAPAGFPPIPPVAGVRLAAAAAGVRYRGRDDVMLAALPPGSAVAGVFTTSRTAAAPVRWCQARLDPDRRRGPVALLVNAGNANAFTGAGGEAGARRMAELAAAAVGGDPADAFVASTGVIGEPLDVAPVEAAMAGLRAGLAPDGWARAAAAIMTTDTFPKGAAAGARVDGAPVRVAGVAKGSGMIAPDMATMLAFVFTDAAVAPAALQTILADIAGRTFNCITVDGDTSTSDTLLLAATGGAEAALRIDHPGDPRAAELIAAIEAVMRDLAHQVVRDGEGASKFVAVAVTGAETDAAARRIGLSIANSPLVKTAVAGEDPNWGRVVMAVGKAGEAADRDRLSIRFGPHLVAERGWVAPGYDEPACADYMRRPEIEIAVDVGVGAGAATVWTCDLTAGYVAINADYRS